MNITKREKKLIIFVLILAILCVYYIYFLKPYFDDMNDLAADKSNKQVQVATNEQQLTKIQLLDEEITQKEKQLEQHSVNLSQGFDQPPILVYLEDVVTKNAQKVMFEFSDVSKFEQLEICPITITMKSTYDNLKIILDELSDDEYFFKVTSLGAIVAEPELIEVETQQYDDVLGEYTEITTQEVAPDGNLLDVTLSLEYYSTSGEIPSDTVYTFDDDSVDYGGDIFF